MLEKYYYTTPDFNKNKGFFVQTCGITYPHNPYYIYRPCSTSYIIEYITGGEGTLHYNGKEYLLKDGDVCLFAVGSNHKYYSSQKDPMSKKWLDIKGDLCYSFITSYGIENKVLFSGADIDSHFNEFIEFLSKDPDSDSVDREGAVFFLKIVQALAMSTEKKQLTAPEKAKRFIDENIYKKISAEDVSLAVGLSVSRLGKLFKDSYGITVYQYILQRKIEVSQNLLKNSLFQINQISEMLGFADENYFSNVFNSKVKMRPSEYRRKYSILS